MTTDQLQERIEQLAGQAIPNETEESQEQSQESEAQKKT